MLTSLIALTFVRILDSPNRMSKEIDLWLSELTLFQIQSEIGILWSCVKVCVMLFLIFSMN